MADDGGFLSRWSRKAGARSDAPAPPSVASTPTPAKTADSTRTLEGGTAAEPHPAAASGSIASVAPPVERAPPPTLDDVARLTRNSDFSPFIGRDVDAAVRNAAMKKLFSDPHFNVMDGLDTYIDDYGKADPIPPSMLRRMTSRPPSASSPSARIRP